MQWLTLSCGEDDVSMMEDGDGGQTIMIRTPDYSNPRYDGRAHLTK